MISASLNTEFCQTGIAQRGVNISAAREMNGSLTAHSDGLGQGATFTLDLLLPVGGRPSISAMDAAGLAS